MQRSLSKRPITVALLAVLAGALTVGLIVGWGGLNQQNVATILERAGPLGPIAIVVLMMLAVVISPLPSAPIAIAAGAGRGTGRCHDRLRLSTVARAGIRGSMDRAYARCGPVRIAEFFDLDRLRQSPGALRVI